MKSIDLFNALSNLITNWMLSKNTPEERCKIFEKIADICDVCKICFFLLFLDFLHFQGIKQNKFTWGVNAVCECIPKWISLQIKQNSHCMK